MSVAFLTIIKAVRRVWRAHRLVSALLCGILALGLAGCRRSSPAADHLESVMHGVKIEKLNYDSDPLLHGMPKLPEDYQVPQVHLNGIGDHQGLTLPQVDVANEKTMNYYTTICDVYWKLNWIRKELLRGNVPYNMEDEIGKSRKKLETMTHDGNYDLAAEAFDRFEKGLEHLACVRTMHDARIDDLRIPWETDAIAIQEYLDPSGGNNAQMAPFKPMRNAIDDAGDDETPGFTLQPGKSGVQPNPARIQAVNLVLDYASRYHESPRALMQKEWETAIRKTNRLRDNLYLQNRAENKDGDGTEVSTAISLAAGDPSTIHMPSDAGKSSLAPSPVVTRT